MRCPHCNHNKLKVTDKRVSNDELGIRRRRECLKCKARFTTYERPEISLYVIKKDGRREKFSREKLMSGLKRACEKRPVSHEKIEELASLIEGKCIAQRGTEVKSRTIGETVMKELKKLDKVAYIRFASVYKDFTDITDFKKELEGLK